MRRSLFRWTPILLRAALVLLGGVCCSMTLAEEPNWKEIDRNGNGMIEPAEISAKDLAIAARYASLVGRDISQAIPIGSLLQGRLSYLRRLDGRDGASNVWTPAAGEQEFGFRSGSEVRPFGGAGEIAGELTEQIHGRAQGAFLRFDDNRDGLLSQEELAFVYRSSSQSWMRGDRDQNGLLTYIEMVTALIAEHQRRKIAEAHNQSTWNVEGIAVTLKHRQHATKLMDKFDRNKNGTLEEAEVPDEWKTGNGLAWADANGDGRITTREMQTGSVRFLAENESAHQRKMDPNWEHCKRLAKEVLKRFDRNQDRTLSSWEWDRIGGEIAESDLNENGWIAEDELARWLLGAATSEDLTDSLPDWFLESDADLDGQVTLAEFLAVQPSQRSAEFSHRDRNADGIVTSRECRQPGAVGKMRYSSSSPRILEAMQEVDSHIDVPDPITIADIDVQVSIAKDGDDDLELRLVGPDGSTATLYTTSSRKAWGGGRMFANTTIDDEAPQAPGRLPSPPEHRSFRPQSMGDQRLHSLSVFYGRPAQGTWRLVIGNKAQNKGQNAGLLNGWALLIRAKTSHDAPRQP